MLTTELEMAYNPTPGTDAVAEAVQAEPEVETPSEVADAVIEPAAETPVEVAESAIDAIEAA
jgi:hypothetical protein